MKNPLHRWELIALWSLAVLVISGSIYIATLAGKTTQSETYGIVIGGLMAALPMLINAMRNIGQAQAMQSMAEQLKKLSEEASLIIDGVAKGSFSQEEKRYLGTACSYT